MFLWYLYCVVAFLRDFFVPFSDQMAEPVFIFYFKATFEACMRATLTVPAIGITLAGCFS
jgi:hypothetical protein